MQQRKAQNETQPILLPSLHQGPKGEVGLSGEQGIPGPPVCCELIHFIHLEKLKHQLVYLFLHGNALTENCIEALALL